MEEKKTLSLVLPENWHFLRGGMKGWGFKCKLSNCILGLCGLASGVPIMKLVDFAPFCTTHARRIIITSGLHIRKLGD